MREWNYGNLVIIHDERDAIAELAHINEVADATDRRGQAVRLYFALEKLLHVNYVEATRLVSEARFLLQAIVSCQVGYDVWLDDSIVDCVKVRLVKISTRTNI